jgi:hypothetical protein
MHVLQTAVLLISSFAVSTDFFHFVPDLPSSFQLIEAIPPRLDFNFGAESKNSLIHIPNI